MSMRSLQSANTTRSSCPAILEFRAEKIRTVPLGINLQGYERSAKTGSGPFTVGFFARVAPEKGLHVLADAYRRLRLKEDFSGDSSGDSGGARLEVAGYLAPEHKEYLN